ncbi:MAG: enoyl-CoA hydratase/isomerase family protein [Gemmatimonadota bacterium]|nr:MAG: enoyl-CoA hydratase/isomerase family protein [Gemmatimonadota bacterium]
MTAADTSESLVLSSVEDHVGTVVLNRPGLLNAFNLVLARQFLAALEEFSRDEDVRAVVIRGAGKVFSAGGDIGEMLGHVRKGEDRAAFFRAPLSAFGEIVVALRQTAKPVLAAVHGAVAGVAFNVMLACDLKIAADTTRFTQAFIKIGLSPDGGGTWFLPRLVGYARASELALLPTGLDAATAREWGLINWVVPEADFETSVRQTALRLARGPAAAMARAKALLNSAYEHDMASHIEAERLAQVDNAASPDFEEGLTAFVENREPRFGR